MKSNKPDDIVVTGVGISSAIGQGTSDFTSALLDGRHNFSIMQRKGRQYTFPATSYDEKKTTSYLGAEIPDLVIPDTISKSLLRTASFSVQAALTTLHQAWHDADLDSVDPHRIGLVVGGSNVQQRELVQIHDSYKDRAQFLRPTYAMSFMDSDLCGSCTEAFGIRGFAYTVGGASASGQIAVLQAIQAVESGQADVCIALGSLMDLSYWECQGFRSIGAMGSDRYAQEPDLACRPFDKDRDGFIFGESCGAVVIEKAHHISRDNITPYARLTGWASSVDGNRNPNPSLEGEVGVIHAALKKAGLQSGDVDYVNPHGTGSFIGDEIEIEAIHTSGLSHAYLNATKSITGHGLSATGIVELIAVLMQMQVGKLHPMRNFDNPIDPTCNWVKNQALDHTIINAINLSFGFGGVNSAVSVQRY